MLEFVLTVAVTAAAEAIGLRFEFGDRRHLYALGVVCGDIFESACVFVFVDVAIATGAVVAAGDVFRTWAVDNHSFS